MAARVRDRSPRRRPAQGPAAGAVLLALAACGDPSPPPPPATTCAIGTEQTESDWCTVADAHDLDWSSVLDLGPESACTIIAASDAYANLVDTPCPEQRLALCGDWTDGQASWQDQRADGTPLGPASTVSTAGILYGPDEGRAEAYGRIALTTPDGCTYAADAQLRCTFPPRQVSCHRVVAIRSNDCGVAEGWTFSHFLLKASPACP